MGEAKRKKEARSDKAAIAAMKDLGISLPALLPDIDAKTLELALVTAGQTRISLNATARVPLQNEPDRKVNVILGALKAVVFPTSDARNEAVKQVGGLEIACRKGCAWCCHQNVEVSILEAILIAVETGAPGDVRGDAIDRSSVEFSGLDDMGRARTGKPCPLLDTKGSCSVYEIRPLACRSYFSPDAEKCREGFESVVHGDGTAQVSIHGMPQIMGCAVRAGVNGFTKDLGLQHDDVDLVVSIAAIRNDPNIIELWAAGEKPFTPRMPDADRPSAKLQPPGQ